MRPTDWRITNQRYDRISGINNILFPKQHGYYCWSAITPSQIGCFTHAPCFQRPFCSYLVNCAMSSFSEFSTGIRSTTSCCSLGLLFRTTWKSCSTCLTSSPQSASSKSFFSSIWLFPCLCPFQSSSVCCLNNMPHLSLIDRLYLLWRHSLNLLSENLPDRCLYSCPFFILLFSVCLVICAVTWKAFWRSLLISPRRTRLRSSMTSLVLICSDDWKLMSSKTCQQRQSWLSEWSSVQCRSENLH